MITYIILAFAAYIVYSYVAMFLDLKKGAGPGGLGWLGFPFAPLIGWMMLLGDIRRLARRIFSRGYGL